MKIMMIIIIIITFNNICVCRVHETSQSEQTDCPLSYINRKVTNTKTKRKTTGHYKGTF